MISRALTAIKLDIWEEIVHSNSQEIRNLITLIRKEKFYAITATRLVICLETVNRRENQEKEAIQEIVEIQEKEATQEMEVVIEMEETDRIEMEVKVLDVTTVRSSVIFLKIVQKRSNQERKWSVTTVKDLVILPELVQPKKINFFKKILLF